MIIYFSATGNSKYVANALSHELDDQIVCANDYIKTGKIGRFYSDTPYIFVFPIYISNMAEIFAKFLMNSSFDGCKKSYFFATCAGDMGAAPNESRRFCAKKGLEYAGTAKIFMPQNYIALFTMTEPEEISKRLADCQLKIKKLAEVISNRGIIQAKESSPLMYGLTKSVEKLYNALFTQTKKFYATDQCVGCNLCVKNCPLNNIELLNHKPVWKGKCIHCMACINRCPKNAIEYGKRTLGKKRYTCTEYPVN